jgi:hypothetical protein
MFRLRFLTFSSSLNMIKIDLNMPEFWQIVCKQHNCNISAFVGFIVWNFLLFFFAPASSLPMIVYHTSPRGVLGGQSGLFFLCKYFGFPFSFIVPPKLHTIYFNQLPSTLLKNGLQTLMVYSTHVYEHKLPVSIVQNLCRLRYGLFSCYA